MKKLTNKLLILAAALVVLLAWHGSAKAASWLHVDQLGHIPVSQVVVDPSNHLEIAAVSGGSVWFSHDGGLTWRNQAFPAGLPTSIAYDPVHQGVIAVGTYNTCLMESHDGGLTWTRHKVPFNYYCNVLGVVGTKTGFVFNIQQVIGYTTHLFRLSSDDSLVDLSSFSDPRAGALAYDEDDNRLCVGTTQEVYCSVDDAATWTRLAAANQIGNSPHNILIHKGEPWLLSDKGVFVYRQNGWIAQIPNNPAVSGNPLNGLAVNGGSVIFGSNSSGNGDVDIFTSIAPESTGLKFHIYDLSEATDVLFAATSDGLFVTRELTHSEAQIRRPVIVIPGITGSLPGPKNLGALELDPITHTYDPLIARLRAAGYVDDKTLFPFPYDWRVPNEVTAELLKEQIAEAKAVCGCSKVDIVAHSMGGLVARSYVQGSDYADDVNKLIEVGTPNAGSVAAYYTWEGGELWSGGTAYDRMQENLLSGLFHIEAFSKGYANFTQYIRERVTSTQELLPAFSYIHGRTYPNNYPQNSFLDQLDAQASVRLLKDRVKLKLIGADTLDTLKQLVVDDPVDSFSWPDGKVISNSSGPGDGTVLTSSLESINRADDFEDASHGKLTTVAQNTIIRYLLEDDLDQAYLGSVPAELDKQQAVQAADAKSNIEKQQLLYVLGNGTVTSSSAADYLGNFEKEHLVNFESPAAESYKLHFVESGKENEEVTFGGILLDFSSDAEPLAGQDNLELAPGDSIDIVYDVKTQTVGLGQIVHPLQNSPMIDDSGANNPGNSIPAKYTKGSLEGGLIGKGIERDRIKSRMALSALNESSSKPNYEAMSAMAETGSVSGLAKTAVKITVLPKLSSFSNFGLQFWLSIASIISLMLALVIWSFLEKRS
jgi:hypothetical protein